MDSFFALLLLIFATAAEEVVPSLLWEREKTVWVREGRVIVDRAFLSTRKKRMAVTMFKSAAKEVGNAVFWYDASAAGPSSGTCGKGLPLVAIAKTRAGQCGRLVPNPYFGDLDVWAVEARRLGERSRALPWERRDPRVFWRGVIRKMACENDRGNFARLQATALTLEFPDDVDVRCTKCSPRSPDDECPGLRYGPLEDQALRAFTKPAAVVPPDAYAGFQFLLNLPGSTTGSYSRNLNHLWALGAVVLLWDVGGREWYSKDLADGITHLVVNQSTVVEQLRRVRDDPVLARTLRDGAARVHATHIVPSQLRKHLAIFFWRYRALFASGLFDDTARLRAALHRSPLNNDCSHLDLVEVTIQHPSDIDQLSLADLRQYQESTNATLFRQLQVGGGGGLPSSSSSSSAVGTACDRLLLGD